MVCKTEFHCPPLFFIQSLFVCLLSWSRPFAMAENSLVDSGLKGMSCSTPVNPFKARNPFTSESASSVDSSMHVESPGRRFQSSGPFAWPLDPSVHGSSASHRFHSKNSPWMRMFSLSLLTTAVNIGYDHGERCFSSVLCLVNLLVCTIFEIFALLFSP